MRDGVAALMQSGDAAASIAMRATGYGTVYILEIALLLIGLALLPITPSDLWKPDAGDDPNWRIMTLLAASVGLPYVILAMTSPLLSRWLARIDSRLQPARFFAASNFGSLIGLLSYPFVFERTLTSGAQTLLWSWAFAAYAALLTACALITMTRAKGDEPVNAGALLRATRGADPVLYWICYAGLGSVLLLAVVPLFMSLQQPLLPQPQPQQLRLLPLPFGLGSSH
jgi:hypothetical protein